MFSLILWLIGAINECLGSERAYFYFSLDFALSFFILLKNYFCSEEKGNSTVTVSTKPKKQLRTVTPRNWINVSCMS